MRLGELKTIIIEKVDHPTLPYRVHINGRALSAGGSTIGEAMYHACSIGDLIGGDKTVEMVVGHIQRVFQHDSDWIRASIALYDEYKKLRETKYK